VQLIVADDLSGAADTAVAFRVVGWSAQVVWDLRRESRGSARLPHVLAIDTRSRRMSLERARDVTTALFTDEREAGSTFLYKKIDSTLRGHVGGELRAALDAWHPDAIALVAPAFPAVGRVTVDGCQRAGIAGLGSIHQMLKDSGVAAEGVNLTALRRERPEQLAARASGSIRALIFDAETDDDLVRIARAGRTLDRPVLWVGSGGLARALARSAPGPGPASVLAPNSGPLLAVVGSAHEASRRQVAALVEAGVIHLAMSAGALAATRAGGGADADNVQAVLMNHLKEGRDVVVTIDAGSRSASEDGRLSASLAASLRAVADLPKSLIVTGGETAEYLFDAWDITGLDLAGEIEPGVPAGWTIGRRQLPVVVKAGGFGDAETLVRAREHLSVSQARRADPSKETAWDDR
jgi:4-hydroxythreonine-4-phosphate dehydrogenase